MFKPTAEGSTARLLQLCLGYLITYVIYGLASKYFTGTQAKAMSDLAYLAYTTSGGALLCLAVVIAGGWWRFNSDNQVRLGPLSFPAEFLYIVPSGVCTAVVIPTTTLMYTLPISVMVAMVIMRGAVIIISRVVDAIQIRQKILVRRVYGEENIAVVFALGALSIPLFAAGGDGHFDFVGNPAAMSILGAYVTAYAIRIYIMNYYKNTRPKGAKSDNRAFFAVEQISSTLTLALVTVVFVSAFDNPVAAEIKDAFVAPKNLWVGASLAGAVFGIGAFFSVFIFMFKGRTATFAGLVNRLTSLVAGTMATLLFVPFGGKWPKLTDWGALGLILVAVYFLTRAERRRAVELAQEMARR